MQVLERQLPGRLTPADAAAMARLAEEHQVGADAAPIRSCSPERLRFLTRVLTRASEGWIGYWATDGSTIGYWSTGEDWPGPERGGARAPQLVGLADLAAALNNQEELTKYVGSVDMVRIERADLENDAGQLDADDCDALFHLVLLGGRA